MMLMMLVAVAVPVPLAAFVTTVMLPLQTPCHWKWSMCLSTRCWPSIEQGKAARPDAECPVGTDRQDGCCRGYAAVCVRRRVECHHNTCRIHRAGIELQYTIAGKAGRELAR